MFYLTPKVRNVSILTQLQIYFLPLNCRKLNSKSETNEIQLVKIGNRNLIDIFQGIFLTIRKPNLSVKILIHFSIFIDSKNKAISETNQ